MDNEAGALGAESREAQVRELIDDYGCAEMQARFMVALAAGEIDGDTPVEADGEPGDDSAPS